MPAKVSIQTVSDWIPALAGVTRDTPQGRAMIPSLEPVAAVLEVAAGRAAELGIEAGDKVAW